MYIVEWEQWYRCGKYGDDKDFEIYRNPFPTEAEARVFADELVEGKHRGFADMKVTKSDITIIKE
jgi:hypothetical protein